MSQAAITQKLTPAAMSRIATGASATATGRARTASLNFVTGFNTMAR
jgi:hypothetical protein